jgi:transcription elongation GreA/GreB family factor
MSDSKHDLIQSVLKTLQDDLDVLRKAALETHKSSTSDESKAEGKYDTRGLEASYLAEAQAGQVVQLEESIAKFKLLNTEDLDGNDPIASGSMIVISTDNDDIGYLMLPAGGGTQLESQGLEFTVITPDSPIGSILIGKLVGEQVELPQHGSAFISDLW